LVTLCIVLSIVPIGSAAGSDPLISSPLQTVYSSMMGASTDEKNQFADILTTIMNNAIENNIYSVDDDIVDEAYSLRPLKVMERSAVEEALQVFAAVADSKKTSYY